ncbi:aldo/keto reductase [Naasia lichenicola]|uniref:aldo/keto reductase n=1 Tax=Naasia lichenicola TaxID=2565933 RepID=UPI0018EEB172|nr:aldo/keto reductase [Naasia lichenicola]
MTGEDSTASDIAAPFSPRTLGRTGLVLPAVTVGAAAWGTDAPLYRLAMREDDVTRTMLRGFAQGLTAIDTSNNYGDGESERRIGQTLRSLGGLPDGVLLQTKLDRDPVTGTFEADRMRRSLEESLERLGVPRLPLLFLHDPEHIGFERAMEPGGPVESLLRFRDEGYTDFVGISGGPASMLERFVDTGLFDALITHNRHTLVDRTASRLLSRASEAGMGVFNAALYGGGVLARWPRISDRYHYAPASSTMLAAIDAMGAACAAHDVPLAAAALQFSIRDPRVHSTICGVVSPEQVDETIELASHPIPDELWAELETLVPDRAEWSND